jgi:hypothetical protein
MIFGVFMSDVVIPDPEVVHQRVDHAIPVMLALH